jgi:hypothetical protein
VVWRIRKMKQRLEAHKNALLLSFALTALIVGIGCVPVANAYSSFHHYVVGIFCGPIQWGHMGLATTAYSSGSHLGTVITSQTSDANWPLTVSENGAMVTTVDAYTAIASGSFTVQSWILWILPIRTQTYTLYTEVGYEPNNNFFFYDWYA